MFSNTMEIRDFSMVRSTYPESGSDISEKVNSTQNTFNEFFLKSLAVTALFSAGRRIVLPKFGLRVYGIGRNLAVDSGVFLGLTWYNIYRTRRDFSKLAIGPSIGDSDEDNIENSDSDQFERELESSKRRFKSKFWSNSQYWH